MKSCNNLCRGLLWFTLLALLGCGERTCKKACEKFYPSLSSGETDEFGDPIDDSNEHEGCEVVEAGGNSESCIEDCLAAWETEGELVDYDPYFLAGMTERIDNRAEVKEWAECVEKADCEDLHEGYCYPNWVY